VSIEIAKTFPGITIDYGLLVAGAILHDYGKLKTYDEDRNITIRGRALDHIIIGIMELTLINYEYVNEPEFIKLIHVIASHHAKLEYGSPVKPAIPEAVIISRADGISADLAHMQKVYETGPDKAIYDTLNKQ